MVHRLPSINKFTDNNVHTFSTDKTNI